MSKLKRVGIIFIVVGAFIPSVLYPFASLTSHGTKMQVILASKGAAYELRLNDLEIVLKEGVLIKGGSSEAYYEGRVVIPYQYTLAIGITIAFLGISIIALL